MFTKRIAIVSVINDLVTDNRILRTAEVLRECGYDVLLAGRQLPGSMPLPAWPYRAVRMKMIFRTGPFFYFFYNLRLFFLLLFRRADLLVANDLDTLLPNYIVSRIKKIPLVYDSHEIFCEVPELQNSPLKKKIWESLEKKILPRLKYCITVNHSIAQIFNKKYGTDFKVVRNISLPVKNIRLKSRAELDLPADKRIVLLQGAGINIDRGAEELVYAMKSVENILLLVIGSGDVWPILEQIVKNEHLEDKVRLIKKIPKEELVQYTHNADLGLSIDKPSNLNYLYSLPNKIFDYIQAQVPVLVSRLPELELIVNTYKVGEFIDNHEPSHLAVRIGQILKSEKLPFYKSNCGIASAELNGEKEKEILRDVIMTVGQKMYF